VLATLPLVADAGDGVAIAMSVRRATATHRSGLRLLAPLPEPAMNPMSIALAAALCAASIVAQEPSPPPAPVAPAAPTVAEGWTEGQGRGPSYRAALACALEDAVGRKHGVAVLRGPGIRSRLAVVAKDAKADVAGEGCFTGDAELEREWVGHQLTGYVETYEVARKDKGADGAFDVAVRARIAAYEPGKDAFVIDLVDDDLRRWRLERFEEGVDGGSFARDEGAYESPSVRENLRATGRVRFAAKAGGVKVGAAADPRERAKEGRQLAPSHRVVIAWQPMQFRSLLERPNRARPTTGPRPQCLIAGSVRVAVKVADLVQDVELFDRTLTLDLPIAEPPTVDKLDALAVQLGDLAKAAVAEAVFFALQPPVVTRKWAAGDGGEWHVEVAMPRRVALAYESFAVGMQGSLASPDWRPLGRAVYVGGADAQCDFRLVDVIDVSRIEEGVAEVRPARK